uniref:Uncharacterized protein n=1 Tax=Anguilla anguilla TaxID=7936 RepID=A0A0E9PVJ7_ANGAN
MSIQELLILSRKTVEEGGFVNVLSVAQNVYHPCYLRCYQFKGSGLHGTSKP